MEGVAAEVSTAIAGASDLLVLAAGCCDDVLGRDGDDADARPSEDEGAS